jgi:hypothetical protein
MSDKLWAICERFVPPPQPTLAICERLGFLKASSRSRILGIKKYKRKYFFVYFFILLTVCKWIKIVIKASLSEPIHTVLIKFSVTSQYWLFLCCCKVCDLKDLNSSKDGGFSVWKQSGKRGEIPAFKNEGIPQQRVPLGTFF